MKKITKCQIIITSMALTKKAQTEFNRVKKEILSGKFEREMMEDGEVKVTVSFKDLTNN